MRKNNVSEAENEVYRFIKILVVLVILLLGVYLFTNKFVNKESNSKISDSDIEISDKNIIVGSILNRPYTDYYVIAYQKDDNNAVIFDTFVNMYETQKNALNIYVIDLGNNLNKSYISDKSNQNAKSISDLKISGPTLLKISNKKIVKYIEGQDEIKKELGI